jgi:multiple sugar transport system permease protein
MAATAAPPAPDAAERSRRADRHTSAGRRPRQTGRHLFLAAVSLLWLVPLAWAVFTSLRPYGETRTRGYLSWPHSLSLDNFTNAWQQSDMARYFWNSVLITVPAVLLTPRPSRSSCRASPSASTSRC